ncbi:MAG: SLC13 family permease [Desulfovibrionaceae bacterium]
MPTPLASPTPSWTADPRVRWAVALVLPGGAAVWLHSLGLGVPLVLFTLITLWALCLWAMELLPDALVAVLIPILYIVTGVGKPAQILSPWTLSIGWLVLGGLMIGAFMMKTGLARRLALRSIQAVGGSFLRLLWGILLAGLIMAPFIPSVLGRSSILTVVCIGVCQALDLKKYSREASAVILAGFVAVAAPKLAFLTGGADIAMAMNLGAQVTGVQVTWLQYSLHNFLPALLYGILSMLCIIVMLRPKIEASVYPIINAQLASLGPMSRNEYKSMGLLCLLLLLLVSDSLHGVNVGWIMLLLPSLAFFPGIGLLDKQDFGKLNFTAVFFITGCMSIGAAAKASGMDKVLADSLLPLLSGSELYTVMATYVAGIGFNALLTPLAAYASLTTALTEIAIQLQVPPLLVLYTYNYGLDQYLFPYEYPVLLFFYATGYVSLNTVIKVMGLRMLVAAPFIAGIAYPYWKYCLQ